MTELVRDLLAVTLASSVGIVAALLLRRPVRLAFGAFASYCIWLFVPVATAAVLLPQMRGPASGGTFELVAVHALRIFDPPAGALARGLSHGWPEWMLGVWCAGLILSVLYLAGLQRAFVRTLGTLSGSRCVLRAEHSAGCPALLGVIRPRVVLPADFNLRYTRLERILVVAHERAHLRRGDSAWNAIVALMRCICWFNPLIHLASICFRLDQEIACDAVVLAEYPGSRRSYASAMLKTQLTDAQLPVGCHWRSGNHLKERIEMIKRVLPGRTRRTLGHVVVAVSCLMVGCSMWAAQPPAAGTRTVVLAKAVVLAPASSIRVSGEDVRVEDTGGATRVTGPKFRIVLASEVRYDVRADRMLMLKPSDGARLEGHVLITASNDVRPLTANAERAVLTPQPGGGIAVDFENGTVQF